VGITNHKIQLPHLCGDPSMACSSRGDATCLSTVKNENLQTKINFKFCLLHILFNQDFITTLIPRLRFYECFQRGITREGAPPPRRQPCGLTRRHPAGSPRDPPGGGGLWGFDFMNAFKGGKCIQAPSGFYKNLRSSQIIADHRQSSAKGGGICVILALSGKRFGNFWD
jgi:hypothetical protein